METEYVVNSEDFVPSSGSGDGQTEELADENKSLIWMLLKQVGFLKII